MKNVAAVLFLTTLLYATTATAGDKPIIKPRSYTLPGAKSMSFDFDPGGVKGCITKVGPRPIAFNPSVSFGWQASSRWRLNLLEIRSTGGADAMVGLGLNYRF